tara:strand:+ start:1060 stop:2715 length:1656 start_codon:yes stop_codon:yes gene_type:complete
VTLKNTTDRYYLIFVCLAFITLIIGLGSYGLAESSEARYAEISREMFLLGDYLNPQLLGIFHFHKPPLTYYITTLGYSIFGINEFGARFFLQIAVAIQLLLVYGLANLLFRKKRIAFISGVIYFSMPIVLISSRNLTTDAFLTTFIMVALYCWQYYANKGKLLFLYLFYLFLGLAILTKGPVAILFVLVYIITYKIIFKVSFKINIHHIIGFVVCLMIGASWFVLVMIENQKLWNYFIEKQIAGRMTGGSFGERSKPFWYFIPILIGLILPWLIGSVPNFIRKFIHIYKSKNESLILLVSSILLVFLFSSFSTKLILYILPIFWMLAIFIAKQLDSIDEKSNKYINIAYLIILSIIFIGLLICWYFDFEFIHIETLAIITTFLLTIFSFLAYYLIDNDKNYKAAVVAAIFGVALLLISSTVLRSNSSLINSTRQMTDYINNISKSKLKTILVYDYLLTSIPFYSDARYITLKSNHKTTDREVQFQNDDEWKKQLWDINKDGVRAELLILSNKPNTFLLIRDKSTLDNNLKFLNNAFKHRKEYSKWTILYNK